MLWYKESGRIINECGRLSDAEIGLLFRLVHFAWQQQGITVSDLRMFAQKTRTPIECVRLAWDDFLSFAIEKNGKFMTAEQWEGVETYEKTRRLNAERIAARWKKPITENKQVTDTDGMQAVYNRNTDGIQNRIDKNRNNTTVNKGAIDAHAHVPAKETAPLAAARKTQTPANEQTRVLDGVVNYLAGCFRLPLIPNERAYYGAAETVLAFCEAGTATATIDAFLKFRPDAKLKFFADDFSGWFRSNRVDASVSAAKRIKKINVIDSGCEICEQFRQRARDKNAVSPACSAHYQISQEVCL